MCAVPNMAVFCSSLTSWSPGMSLTYFLIIIIIIIIIIINNSSSSSSSNNKIQWGNQCWGTTWAWHRSWILHTHYLPNLVSSSCYVSNTEV